MQVSPNQHDAHVFLCGLAAASAEPCVAEGTLIGLFWSYMWQDCIEDLSVGIAAYARAMQTGAWQMLWMVLLLGSLGLSW